jgi:hypothetical protein
MFATPAWAQNRVWNNARGNNTFEDLGNWTNNPAALTGVNADWRINSVGANRAEVTSAIGNVQQDISVGRGAAGELFVGPSGSLATRDVYAGSLNASGNGIITVEGALSVLNVGRDLLIGEGLAEGSLFIEGGTVNVTRNVRLGRNGGTDGYGQVTINGGSLIVGSNIFTGQSNRLQNVFTLNSGTVAVTVDLNVAHNDDLQSVVDILGGRFTVGGAGIFSDGLATSFLNLSGDAELDVAGTVSFATGRGGISNVTIKDTATLAAGVNLRVGNGADSTVTLNIEGGSISAPDGFTSFASGSNSIVNVTMSGGSITGDRINWAGNAAGEVTLNMTGGTINVVSTGTNTTSGAFSMQEGKSELNMLGTALVNTEKLNINNGGELDLGGAAVMNVTGAEDGRASFDFAATTTNFFNWSDVKGVINFSSLDAILQVTGTGETATFTSGSFSDTRTYNFATLFNEAIANDVFTKSVGTWPGYQFQVAYDPVKNFTTVQVVVPEPSAFVLGLGGVALLGLASRARRRRG